MFSYGLPYTSSTLTPRPTATSTDSTMLRTEVRALRAKVEQQNLIMQTLLRLLIKKGAFDKEEFSKWMIYVDELDGTRDGKLRKEKGIKNCAMCNRVNPIHAAKCLYCGVTFEETKFLTHEPPQNAPS